MPDVVVRAPLDLPGGHRQQGLGAIDGLHLRLLVARAIPRVPQFRRSRLRGVPTG